MKNVIITGSSRGIGFELVKLFNQNNFNVVALSRNTKPISNLKLKNVKSLYLDISSSESINKTKKLVIEGFKKIDILINNAGINKISSIDKLNINDVRNILYINLEIPTLISSIVSKNMIKKKLEK